MAIVEMFLDPDAQSYTDLADLDAAAATKLGGIEEGADVNPADLDGVPDSPTRLAMTDVEDTKLGGIADGAEVNPADLDGVPDSASRFAAVEANAKDDQDGGEIRDLVVALADLDRKILITDPVIDEFKVISVQRRSDGKLGVDYNETAET